ncbi:MAG: valine--tRNA ligase [Chlamydiales bacterium]
MEKIELPKTYNPKTTDTKWYRFWEENHFFKPKLDSNKPPYCIVMPPPNVTGVLHMGHALVSTLQDILIRWKRMSGFQTLWIPGTDHAGIATQTVVERHLMATEGKRRDDYTRDDFLKIVWQWKEKSEKTILNQLKALGCSCDWSRLQFTMSDACNRAVRTLFKKMFNEGLIYQGNYLVNWDPVTQTALADDEVEYEERESFLWYFKYPLADSSGSVQIATTRPETMLGDTAIAVSPKDPRYRSLVGKKVRLPILDREIPIIADHHVDPEFGTGMVKITPAHDPNDYRIGIDHGLEFINIMTPNGQINENGGPFRGLSREEARTAVVEEMEAMGLLEKVQRHTLRVGISYRSKSVIEPYLSKQWFVKMTPFIEKLKGAVQEGKVKIVPKTWESTYFHWVNNLQDWCISRQLWWGHRIPVWFRKDDPEKMICHDGPTPPEEVIKEPDRWEQDPDVLDTWFSSALWPFSTLGWPDNTEDLQKFYPTNVLITGHDIIFFWVARMIFMGEYALGQVPFPETFLHGLIFGKSYWHTHKKGGIHYITGDEKKEYDLGTPLPSNVHSKWEKLSKSKGNVIDPLEMIEEYGTDALRMALCSCANLTPQIDLDRRRFEEYKNFTNKIWNGARFVFMNLTDLSSSELTQGLNSSLFALEDRWILSALNRVNRSINTYLENYAFDQAALTAYDFFWKEFCAYYVEITKPVLFGKAGSREERTNKQKILTIILCNIVRLLHPMAPFITEELFQLLKKQFPEVKSQKSDPYTTAAVQALLAPACIVAPFPTPIEEPDPEAEESFQQIEKIVYTIRNIRGEMNIPSNTATDVYLIGKSPQVQENLKMILALVKIDRLELTPEIPSLKFSATGFVGDLKIMIPLPKNLVEKEKERLEKEREKNLQNRERIQTLLSNADFLSKAKPELVEKQRLALSQIEKDLQSIQEKLAMFQ